MALQGSLIMVLCTINGSKKLYLNAAEPGRYLLISKGRAQLPFISVPPFDSFLPPQHPLPPPPTSNRSHVDDRSAAYSQTDSQGEGSDLCEEIHHEGRVVGRVRFRTPCEFRVLASVAGIGWTWER